MTTRLAVVLGLVALVSQADAAKPVVRGGRNIMMRLGKARVQALSLAYGSSGWALAVEAPKDEVCAVDLEDITPNLPRPFHARESITKNAKKGIPLGGDRYVAGHAYKLTLRCGTRAIGDALVYLAPPPFKKRRAVTLSEDEVATRGGGESDGFAMVPKGSL